MRLVYIVEFIKNMGLRYLAYRVRHEIEKKFRVLEIYHPVNPRRQIYTNIYDWKNLENVLLNSNAFNFSEKNNLLLKESAMRILNGEILFFGKEWKMLGKSYDWLTNPDNGYSYNIDKHWSQVPDFTSTTGDIKYVWEKSRFSYILTLIRYDKHFKHDLSEYVLSEIESWIDQNPVNQGPNWRCSQEISLRVINWFFALEYYKGSSSITSERWGKIQNVIYWSLHHVYQHINFSRIAVRNNHAITETMFLALSNVMFPFIPETTKWSRKGKIWLEQEIEYQIYDDGTFLQFSMNYHRVVIQLFSLGISVLESKKETFSSKFYEKAYKSLYFLYQCTNDETGWLPNYGANDGAWFFPLSDTDYRDYRPQLNTLHVILTNNHLYTEEKIQEDSSWYKISTSPRFPILEKEYRPLSFDSGGYYMVRTQDNFTFIRCGNHKDRPAQADNLHIDLWHGNNNVLRDSGTYRYNTSKELIKYFAGTISHNTVVVDKYSQMVKGKRFIWYFWTQRKYAKWVEDNDFFAFEGRISAFTFLNKRAYHKRIVKVSKTKYEWVIEDEVGYLNDFIKKQVWHCNEELLDISSSGRRNEFDSYNSDYYGILTKEKSIFFEFDKGIKTKIRIDT